MDVNDASVLDMINKYIVLKRLRDSEVLKLIELISISKNFKEFVDYVEWETT